MSTAIQANELDEYVIVNCTLIDIMGKFINNTPKTILTFFELRFEFLFNSRDSQAMLMEITTIIE